MSMFSMSGVFAEDVAAAEGFKVEGLALLSQRLSTAVMSSVTS
jgi:hypothetical protein